MVKNLKTNTGLSGAEGLRDQRAVSFGPGRLGLAGNIEVPALECGLVQATVDVSGQEQGPLGLGQGVGRPSVGNSPGAQAYQVVSNR
jgi:hypothetical protein